MARTLMVGIVVALLAAPFLVAAEVQAAQGTDVLGKGFMAGAAMMAPQMHAGKGDVNVDVQCNDVCNDVCSPVPQKVCNDVPYQTQVCNKVPKPMTKQVCNRICTKTTTMTEQIDTQPTVVSSGKGKGGQVVVSAGKGRKMLGAESTDMLPLMAAGHLAGKAMFVKAAGAVMGAKAVAGAAVMSHAGKGKGAAVVQAPQEDVQCNDVCNDVQIMTYATECQMVNNTKTKCDIVMQQQCNKVCKPNCQKITTTTTVTTTALGKGKGQPVAVSYGKGH